MTSTSVAPLYIEVMTVCRVSDAGAVVTPTPGASALLAVLAERRGFPVNVSDLRRTLWISPPDSWVGLIRGYIRELRRHLGVEAVETIHAPRGRTGAYRLVVPAEATDVGRFRRHGRFGDQKATEEHLFGAIAWYREALSVWGGGRAPHLTGTPRLEALASSWQSARDGMVERYAKAAVAAGVGQRAAAEIATLHRRAPERVEAARLYREICS